MHEHIINTPIKDLPPLVEVIFLESIPVGGINLS